MDYNSFLLNLSGHSDAIMLLQSEKYDATIARYIAKSVFFATLIYITFIQL